MAGAYIWYTFVSRVDLCRSPLAAIGQNSSQHFLIMKTSVIYDVTLRDLRNRERRIRHQGGQYSGKTVNILGALATMACEDKGGVTTVTSMSMPHLKGGALRDFEMYVYPSFKGSIRKYHKTDHLFSFKSGHMMEFKVFESEMDARGPKRNRLFVNEANKFEWLKFFHLDGRSEQTIFDYNPSIKFWAHEEYDNDPKTRMYISDHRHNPFLSEEKHQEIEDIAIFKRDPLGNVLFHDGDPMVEKGSFELWKVYARGATGNIMGIIFPNWEMIEDHLYPNISNDDCIFSIDFGYTNDPTGLVKICKVGKTLFIKELAYETGLSAMSINQILTANGYEPPMPLYCEHDPDMVASLRNLGVHAYDARKGPGSINNGILLLNKHFDVKYTASSQNLHRERSLYIWDTDKATGKSINKPVDRNNHLMDACRYGVYTKYLRNQI